MLPDLRQPTLAHVNRKPVAIAQHVPAVVFDQRDVNETSSRSPDLLYRHQDPFHDRVFCLAAQRELIIRPDGRDPRTHQLAPVLGRLGVGLDSEQPRNAAEEQDLHWLLRMREGGVSYAKRDYNQPVPLLPDIVARVRLGEGILRSHRLSRAENDELRLWYFESRTAPSRPKAVARELAWEVNVRSHVELIFEDFVSGRDQLVFRPPEHLPGRDVEIQVLNVELDRLLGLNTVLFDDDPPSADHDADVAAFYQLASVPPPARRLGLYLPYGRQRGTTRKPCAPGGFEGFL